MRKQPIAVCFVVVLLAGVAWLLLNGSAGPRLEERADAKAAPEAGAVAAVISAPGADTDRARIDDPANSATVAPSAEPGPEELWGRVVVAGTTTPVANADVRLQHRDADEFWNLDMQYGERIFDLARTTSDADGRFHFAVARAHKHRLQVRAAGFANTTVHDCLGGSEVVVGLSPGASIAGIVRGGGAGLADLAVRVSLADESIELAAGRTDGGGAFQFSGLQPGSVYVQVGPPRFAEKWQRLDLKAGEVHRVEIEFLPTKTLRGRVVEATTGTPIADAEVSDSWTFQRIVRSGADGKFTLPGLEDETFVEVHVRASGYASASRNVAGALDAEPEFRLVGGGTVIGRFVTETGAAVASVYSAVGASYMEGPGYEGTDWIRAEVGKDGRFQVLGLRPDQHYWLYVRGRGFGTRVYALARQIASGERLDVGDVVVRAAGGLEGRVVDEAGQPRAGMAVSISGTNSDSSAWVGKGQRPQSVTQFQDHGTKTDSRGRYRFTDLAGGSYTVSVRPSGQSQAISATGAVADGAILEGIELVVPTGSVIEGTLLYADGHGPGDEAAALYLRATPKSGDSCSTRVQPGGHFRIEGLKAENYVLTLFGPPKGYVMPPRLDVAAGTKDLRLVLEPAAFVAGRVVDVDGKSLKAQVWASAAGNLGGSALQATEDDGSFRIEVAPDFHGDVGAQDLRQSMLQAMSKNVTAGQMDLVLTLKPFGR